MSQEKVWKAVTMFFNRHRMLRGMLSYSVLWPGEHDTISFQTNRTIHDIRVFLKIYCELLFVDSRFDGATGNIYAASLFVSLITESIRLSRGGTFQTMIGQKYSGECFWSMKFDDFPAAFQVLSLRYVSPRAGAVLLDAGSEQNVKF